MKRIQIEKTDFSVRKNMETIKNDAHNLSIQVDMINKLYQDLDFEYSKICKSEINKKLQGYKSQDVKKNKNDSLITFEETIEKLVVCKLKCFFCKKKMYILYPNVREPLQWTFDRIDNSLGHSKDNVEACCLACNLKRRLTNKEKFKFTTQLKIKKI